MSKITPCLWFDGTAEEAANFYAALLPDSRVDAVHRAPSDYPSGKAGDVLMVEFTLMGQPFSGLNGGPLFKFNEAVSFQVFCDSQDEIDQFWSKLSAGGAEGSCGWLKDKFGLSWQVVPSNLPQLLTGADAAALDRVMTAVMGMKKFDIGALQRAHAGPG